MPVKRIKGEHCFSYKASCFVDFVREVNVKSRVILPAGAGTSRELWKKNKLCILYLQGADVI
jgi:hypothetical protein